LIEKGDVSLLRAARLIPLRDEDPWFGRQITFMGLRSRGLVEESMKDISELCSNVQESGWSAAIEKEISSDMLNMQCQPLIMDNFRRFVVIKGASDGHVSGESGVSFTHIIILVGDTDITRRLAGVVTSVQV
jgi:hypothetical protein